MFCYKVAHIPRFFWDRGHINLQKKFIYTVVYLALNMKVLSVFEVTGINIEYLQI